MNANPTKPNPTSHDEQLERSPRVTVSVPVYNGQKYIRFTLDSLLAQTFSDFEIIVTDNCSTDSTPKIVLEYAARDARVRYVRNNTNIGPAKNYNRGFELARGEYFKWNPADDVCAPDFLEKCVQALDADPRVVLAYPRTNVIDTNGAVVGSYEYEIKLDDPRPSVRFLRIMNVDHRFHGAHELYGVMRTAAVRASGGFHSHVRGDSVLLARLLLDGKFHCINEHLFFNRDHSDRSSKYLSRTHVRANSRLSKYLGVGPLPSAEWWDPRLKGRIVFPEWRVWREYVRTLEESKLSGSTRFCCYVSLARYTIGHIPKLGRDLIIASEQLLNSAFRHADDTDGKPRGVAM